MNAEVVCLKPPDVIQALIKFAQDNKVTLILVGQTHPGLWNRIFRRSLTSRLLAEAPDFNVEVVAQEAITAKS
jgi:K+-sensing histidine kinase KdpD